MSRLNFERALQAILRFEGGYVDHPADPGGATNMGITQGTLAAWRGKRVTKPEVHALSRAEAAMIYRARYWDAVRGDELPSGLDLALFDLAVNSGVARAVRLLQRALHLKQDGRIGKHTLARITAGDTAELIHALCDERRAFLKALSTFPVFGRGWMARVAAIETLALAMAPAPGASPAAPPSPPTSALHPAKSQETTMDTTKSLLASRTLWANAIGLLAVGLSAFGFNTGALDVGALTDQIFQGVAAGSFVISSLFRVLASKRLM